MVESSEDSWLLAWGWKDENEDEDKDEDEDKVEGGKGEARSV